MNQDQIATCTKLHIEGKSIYDIAPQVNRSPSAVAQTLRRPDIKAYIESEGQKIIQGGLHIARKVILKRAAEGLNKSADDITKDRSLKASVHITNMAGLSGQAPGTIINQLIYSQGTRTELSQDALSMVQRALGLSDNTRDNDHDLGIIDLSPADSDNKT